MPTLSNGWKPTFDVENEINFIYTKEGEFYGYQTDLVSVLSHNEKFEETQDPDKHIAHLNS